MKIIFCITAVFLIFVSVAFAQSDLEFEAGSELTNENGAEIEADVVLINGTYSGGGEINGGIAYVLNFTALLEGFYDSSSRIMASDTVSVYLRNTVSPYTIADSSDAVLNETGAGTFIFSNAVNGTNYYLVIKHRNSIETWSAAGKSFAAFSMIYNLSDAVTKALGNNLVKTGNVWSVYSGDINQDGVIDASDISQAENDATQGLSGYLKSDVTGDNFTDASDLAIVENNSSLYISAIMP